MSDARAVRGSRPPRRCPEQGGATSEQPDDDLLLRVEERLLREVRLDGSAGLVVTNPPYGVRVSADLVRLYSELGDLVRRSGRHLAVLAADRRLTAAAKLRFETAFQTQNGGIRVELLTGSVE